MTNSSFQLGMCLKIPEYNLGPTGLSPECCYSHCSLITYLPFVKSMLASQPGVGGRSLEPSSMKTRQTLVSAEEHLPTECLSQLTQFPQKA